MTDLRQVTSALQRLFHEEGHRIVFWNDPDREFEDSLQAISVDGVSLIRLDEVGALSAKLRLEREQPHQKFLVYAPTEEPDFDEDWLLDIRLYSHGFRADRASILLQELGLASLHLRAHLAERRKFFDAKERVQKLKPLVEPNDSALDLDRKMLSVVARSDQPEPFDIVRTVFHSWLETPEVDLDVVPAAWERIEKFELDGAFWQLVRGHFGYAEENPSLKNLLIRLLVTDFGHGLNGELPQSLRSLRLPQAGTSNTVVCLAQWRDSGSKQSSYERLSGLAALLLRIDEVLSSFELEALEDVKTFLAAEKRIASALRDRVRQTASAMNADAIKATVTRRQAGHWASSAESSSDVPRQALHAVYDALGAAADLFVLRNEHQDGFEFADAAAAYRAYETGLYRFDQLYRQFCEAADVVVDLNILKTLRPDVEALYVNWYLPTLVTAWGKHIEPPQGLLGTWRIPGVPNQQQFFDRCVRSWTQGADNKRAFVIVSDAFRYEAAQELMGILNGTYRVSAELRSQLGVLPSYTALGMASLLPHHKLSYKADGAEVLVDGKASVSTARDGLLQSVGGMAVRFDDLIALPKDKGRDLVRDKRVVYIYHDKVDAIGDDAKTEAGTFQAVRQAIEELASMVTFIVNNLNGHYIVVTADHGFLFTETSPGEPEKSKLAEHPQGELVAKKRYLLGRGLPANGDVWHGSTKVTAGADGDMEFWIPRGANRFHFVGGARFIHGGAMPQEIVVPVLTIKHARGKAADSTRPKPLDVQVLGASHRVTTTRHRFQLIQMEPVSDRVKAVTLRIGIYEGEAAVTNIETVAFDSTSANMDERKKWVNLVLVDRPYDKKTAYRLVLQDAETGIELQSVNVIIDRAFTDDF
jgi:uncharacterized protein (TIGR02687 family)